MSIRTQLLTPPVRERDMQEHESFSILSVGLPYQSEGGVGGEVKRSEPLLSPAHFSDGSRQLQRRKLIAFAHQEGLSGSK